MSQHDLRRRDEQERLTKMDDKKYGPYPSPETPAVDWYCANCSEVVLLKQRCPICGKREQDKT